MSEGDVTGAGRTVAVEPQQELERFIAVLDLISGKISATDVARRYGVTPGQVEGWRAAFIVGGEESLRRGYAGATHACSPRTDLADPRWAAVLKGAITLVAVFLGLVFTVAWMAFITTLVWTEEPWLMNVAKNHVVACILVPLGGVAAFCVVTLLKFSDGPIRFKCVGLELEGAASAALFWILVYLAIAYSVYLNW
jgi:hypothetical protein